MAGANVARMTALAGLGFRLRMAKLHLITDARRDQRDLASFVRAAFEGGVDLVQLRDPRLRGSELASAIEVVRQESAASCALVGRSAHSVDALRRMAHADDIDYLLVGPVRLGAPAGPDPVAEAVSLLPPFAVEVRSKPWFAAGGITSSTIEAVIAQGVRRVSVSRAITTADDPEAEARALKAALVKAWADDASSEPYVLSAFDD